jgi:hypothetical protein
MLSRESSDHASFNRWDRQVYIFDMPDGSSAVRKAWDFIYGNFILANYHSSMAIDNDDGRYNGMLVTIIICSLTVKRSGYFDTHHNVCVYKSQSAAWGGAFLKSDFGGHSNHHHHNIDLFFSKGFSICSQLEASARMPSHSFLSLCHLLGLLRVSKTSTIVT